MSETLVPFEDDGRRRSHAITFDTDEGEYTISTDDTTLHTYEGDLEYYNHFRKIIGHDPETGNSTAQVVFQWKVNLGKPGQFSELANEMLQNQIGWRHADEVEPIIAQAYHQQITEKFKLNDLPDSVLGDPQLSAEFVEMFIAGEVPLKETEATRLRRMGQLSIEFPDEEEE